MAPLLLQGIVTKVGFMNKTATVTVSRWVTHPRTQKRLERSKKYLTHDPNNELRMADEVTIQNCPPVSARKRFRLYKVLYSPDKAREERHRVEALAAKAAATSTASAQQQPHLPPLHSSSTEQTVRA
ncbi:hypothetical protein ACEPAF_3013 [Sanghuangporus sanghuang]|uniref:Nucleic acid-binding protein n=1 Tax=Sanghuangporus baumii TaxID=108892 RepID=A0A9Q5I0P0_SANBA|nr:nucleic acid-binding protein [Sanghuangporus baumii]